MKTDALSEQLDPLFEVLERLERQADDRGLLSLLEDFADDLEAQADPVTWCDGLAGIKRCKNPMRSEPEYN